MGASTSYEDEVGRLLGWSAPPRLRLMPGGASGQTHAVRPSSGDEAPIACVARRLRAESDTGLERATRALADAGIAPRVLAASTEWLIQEYVRDAEAPSALNDAASGQAARVGALARRLHALPPTGADDATFPHCADELGRWIAKATPALAAGGDGALAALEFERVRALSLAGTGVAWRTVVAHGDFHPGNILMSKTGSEACTVCNMRSRARTWFSFSHAHLLTQVCIFHHQGL